MPANYNFTQDGRIYSFDDVFVNRDTFDTSTPTGLPGNFKTSSQDLLDYFLTESEIIDSVVGDKLWSWGGNVYGQLGLNSATASATPVLEFTNSTTWKQTFTGNAWTVLLKTDGKIYGLGFNGGGQLGDGTRIARSTPTSLFTTSTWKKLPGPSHPSEHTCAIRDDGTLWCWGRNDYNQLGDFDWRDKSSPVSVFGGGTNWASVACGRFNTAAIKTDGTLWVWGNNGYGALGINNANVGYPPYNQSTPVQVHGGGTNWKQVSIGYYYSAAIKTDGTLWTWGTNKNRGLGLGLIDTTNRLTPVQVGSGTNWKQVSCGSYDAFYQHNSTLAIKTDGTLWAWGNNDYGQLGISNTLTKSTPVQVGSGTNWKEVDQGKYNSGGIKTDGTAWMWGYNGNGSMGRVLGYAETSYSPKQIHNISTHWKQISVGYNNCSAISSGLNLN